MHSGKNFAHIKQIQRNTAFLRISGVIHLLGPVPLADEHKTYAKRPH